MDVSTPPSLDLACPQAEAEIEKYVHMFRDGGVDKNKIRTWGHHDHSYNNNIYRFHYIISYAQVTINSQYQVLIVNLLKTNKLQSQSLKQLQFIIT